MQWLMLRNVRNKLFSRNSLRWRRNWRWIMFKILSIVHWLIVCSCWLCQRISPTRLVEFELWIWFNISMFRHWTSWRLTMLGFVKRMKLWSEQWLSTSIRSSTNKLLAQAGNYLISKYFIKILPFLVPLICSSDFENLVT